MLTICAWLLEKLGLEPMLILAASGAGSRKRLEQWLYVRGTILCMREVMDGWMSQGCTCPVHVQSNKGMSKRWSCRAGGTHHASRADEDEVGDVLGVP